MRRGLRDEEHHRTGCGTSGEQAVQELLTHVNHLLQVSIDVSWVQSVKANGGSGLRNEKRRCSRYGASRKHTV
jgi:hypothetical protein